MKEKSNNHYAKTQLIPAGRIVGFLVVLLMTGCAGLKRSPAVEPGKSESGNIAVIAADPATAPVISPAVSSPIPTPPVTAVELDPDPKVTSSPVPGSTGQPVTKAAPLVATSPVKVIAPPTPVSQPPKKDSTTSAPTKSNPVPPLDMKSLETRLKETKAIGVFTKIALKNQVDDLLNQFRAHYQGQSKTTRAELRRAYEMLLLKVLALLQDSDPPLAGAIVASREAIWGILADPAKFATI